MPESPPMPEQRRHLRLGSATGICIAAMIGSGIFTVTGLIGPSLGTESNVLIAWIVGGILALTGALTAAEMAAMVPRASATYVLIHETLGARTGFVNGLVTIVVGYIAAMGVMALALTATLKALLPWLDDQVAATVLMLGLTALHGVTITSGARFNDLLVLAKLLIVAVFIVAGLTMAVEPVAQTVGVAADGPGVFSGPMAAAVIMVNFAFLGWSTVSDVGGEVKRPSRNLPLAILGAVGLVLAIYLLINIAYMRVIPPSQMIDPATGRPMEDIGAQVALRLFGESGGSLVTIAIVILLFSTLSTSFSVGGRVIAALSWKRELPAILGRFNNRGAPTAAIVLQGVVATAFIWSSDLAGLLEYTALVTSAFAGLLAVSVLLARWRTPDRDRPFSMPLFPWPPIIFLVLTAWLVFSSAFERPWIAAASAGTVIGLALLRPVLCRSS